MSEMVEQVAKVLSADLSPLPWEELNEWEPTAQAAFLRQARAAIAAMRKPTDAMARAGTSDVSYSQAILIWQDMIDEALK